MVLIYKLSMIDLRLARESNIIIKAVSRDEGREALSVMTGYNNTLCRVLNLGIFVHREENGGEETILQIAHNDKNYIPHSTRWKFFLSL